MSGPFRKAGTYEENPIRLPRETVEQVVPQLDRHLASFFVLFHQYQKHHWLVEGPQFRDLHLFFENSYNQVHAQADEIAERITALGGIPTSAPVEQAKIAYIQHEPEGTFHIRDMLLLDIAHESEIASQLRQTIQLAADCKDYGTEKLLKDILLTVEDRAHHTEHYVGDDSLEIGR